MIFIVENLGTAIGSGPNSVDASGYGGPEFEEPTYGEYRGDGNCYGWRDGGGDGGGEGGGHFDYDEA